MTTATSLYGQSLYDLAAEEGLSEEILKQMEAVNVIFKENPDYITLLLEPSIPRRERLGLLEEAFRDQLHPYLQNFLMILLENNLLRGFGSCCRTFRESYNKDHGIEEATVTSAVLAALLALALAAVFAVVVVAVVAVVLSIGIAVMGIGTVIGVVEHQTHHSAVHLLYLLDGILQVTDMVLAALGDENIAGDLFRDDGSVGDDVHGGHIDDHIVKILLYIRQQAVHLLGAQELGGVGSNAVLKPGDMV